MLQEYEKISQDEIESLATFADNDYREVFCPICQRAILAEEGNSVNCKTCGLKLTGHTLQEVRYLINESVKIHAFNCIKVPTFIVISDNDLNLYLICHDCSTFASIC